MPTIAENNKRIAKNTVYLYIRMLLTMAVSLYTSRVVLNALGVDDYGIFNVVGGLVSMFSLLSGTMYVSISRFLTFELGKGNYSKLSTIFSTSINIQVLLSIITIILAETLGLWFMNCKMNIPLERLYAANWVYQCTLLSFVIGLISAPYHSIIIAHERMSVYAILSIIEVLLKLLIVLSLLILPWDKLIFYALLLVIVSILMRMLYVIYCARHFPESKYHLVFDKSILKEMGKFAGWNYFGAVPSIMQNEGINILMNLFFGIAINAARGIATQVQTAVTQFVASFTVALNPQITKSYADGDKVYMHELICYGAKYTFFLMMLLCVPIFFEAPMILQLWLKTVPDYTVLFVRLTLVVALYDTLFETLTMAMQAYGDIKRFQIIVGSVVLSIFPLTFLFYKFGFPVYYSYIICLAMMLIKMGIELKLLEKMVKLPVQMYLSRVIFRVIPVFLLVLIVPSCIYMYLDQSFLRLVLLTLFSVLSGLLVIYMLGLSDRERSFLKNKISARRAKWLQ